MATVSASLRMFDQMTRPLQQVTQALNMTISAMDQMNNAANTDIRITNTLNTARESIQRAGAGLQELATEQDRARNNQDRLNDSFNRGSTQTNGLISKVKGLVGAYLGFQAIKQGGEATDNYTNQNSRLALINDKLQTQAELQNKIYQAAQRSRGAYGDTVNTVAKLGLLAKDSFKSNDETIAFAELMNKSFKISGASTSESTNGMYQLTQAMASGRLQGDEFRSIMENAPMLAQAIAKYTGKSMGDLREMSADGEITANVIKGALFGAANDINAKFATMPQTFDSVWTSIKNKGVMAFASIMEKVNAFLNSDIGSSAITNISNSLTVLSGILGFVIDSVIAVSTFFNNNWGMIEPIVWGIVGALIVYNAALLINNIRTGEGVIGKVAHAIVTWAETAALIAMTFAQQGLNAALALCPITWIIMGIVMLIAIFYAAVAAVNHFAGTSISATGIIAGVFTALGALIYNIFAAMQNHILTVVEYLVNMMGNGTYAAKRFWVGFAETVLNLCISMTEGFDGVATNLANAFIDGANVAIKGIDWIITALNKIPGIDIGNIGGFDKIGSITSSLKGAKASLNNWAGEAPSDYWKAPKVEMKSIGGAYNTGYGFGKGIESKLKIPNLDDLLKGGKDMDLSKLTSDGNKSLKNIDDKIDISNEHLEMMRDLAEHESIQNFVTLTPTVQVTTGDIKEEADINKIIAKIETYMENELASAAEGVYT